MSISLNPVEFAQIVPMGDHFGLEASPDLVLEDREASSVEALIGKVVMNIDLPEGTILDIETPDHKHLKLSSKGPNEPAA